MTSTNLFTNKSTTNGGSPPSAKRRRLPSWLLPLALIAALGAVIAFAFADRLLPALKVEVLPAVLLADIEITDPVETPAADGGTDFSAPMLFQAAGWFEPDPLPIRATALVDGVVDEVSVLEGETVKKGQLLATLIQDDTRLALDSAERKLEQTVAEHHMHLATIPAVDAEGASVLDQIKAAEARLSELSDRHERIGRLSKGTVSEQEITAARLAVESQRAKIASLKSDHAAVKARLDAITAQSKVFDAMIAAAKVQIAEKRLAHERTRIVSPVDGVVLELKAAPGQKKLLRMDDPDSATVAVLFETGKLQARVDVPLADARQLATGQAALITSDFLPNAEFRGVVTRIVGTADLQRNTLQAKVRVIDPDPRLRPEMLCRVKFLDSGNERQKSPATSGGTRQIMAPLSALFDLETDTASAWIVGEDGTRARLRELTLGRLEKDGHIAVTSGLLAGDRLILPPHDALEDGRRIQISNPAL